ncbi:MAG: hypothetical protein M1518_03200 [Candidatus Thermoplasmatota archaeon]|jgi:hypothetical protein|nr:hypothetical protein [Candidatus Thermoplasmatota archaeon]
MNFYPAILIPLAIFTPLFYLNWNRIDKIVDESLFARFLLFGLLLGVVYVVLFLYSFFTLDRFKDLMLFTVLLFLPILSAGEQLSIITGKYRTRKDLLQLSSSLGGAFSFPVSFSIALVTNSSISNYIFIALVTLFAFLTNVMSSATLSIGASNNKVLLYYNFALLIQMLFSSSIFIEYLYGSYALITIVPEIGVAILLYMKFFHVRLGSI